MPIVNLTARYVETARAEGARLEIRDRKVEGLELRVTQSGAKTWALRYRRQSDGTKRTHTFGRYPEMALEAAREAARDARRVVAKGGDPAGEKQARKAAETFGELSEEWLERHAKANRAPRTISDDRSRLKLHILPAIGATKAGEVTKRDVIRMLDAAAAKPDPRTERKLTHQPNRVFELTRAIFRWALSRDLVRADPTFGVKPPIRNERPRERELSPDEIRTLWLALDRAPASRERLRRQGGDFPMRRATALTMKLALVTGQRIGEVSGIALAELELNDTAPMWKIPNTRTKNDQPHRVPLSPLALQLIAEARELAGDSPWLFPNPTGDGPIDPHAATKALERARPAIGLSDFRVHDLRRTAATRMAEMEVSPHVISRVLNHVSVSKATITSKVYDHYKYDKEKRKALNAWGERLGLIIAGMDGKNVVPFGATQVQ